MYCEQISAVFSLQLLQIPPTPPMLWNTNFGMHIQLEYIPQLPGIQNSDLNL